MAEELGIQLVTLQCVDNSVFTSWSIAAYLLTVFLSEFMFAFGLIWMFECLCFFKQSKDFSACNSLLITVILPQLCSASIVIALLSRKEKEEKKLRQERTKWQKGDLKRRWHRMVRNRQNEPSRRSADSISSRLSCLSIRQWGDFIDYRSHSLTHLHILTLPFLPLCYTSPLLMSFAFIDVSTHNHSLTHLWCTSCGS